MFPLENFTNFNKQKEKYKKNERFIYYYTMIECALMSKFTFKNLPETTYPEYILRSLIRSGSCGFDYIDTNDGKKPYFGIPTCSGITMYYNQPRNAQMVTPLGSSDVKEIGVEVAVGWNNYCHSPEFDTIRLASIFAEIDTSIYSAVLNTRLAPTILARNKKEKDMFEALFNRIYDGKLNVAKLEESLDTYVNQFSGADQSAQNKYVISLTDPQAVDKIQYLSKLFDDLLRRWCNWQGKPMQNTSKMAQVTSDELNESQAFSKIYTYQQYELLQRFIEDVNRINSLDIEVTFSDSWKEFERNEKTVNEFVDDSIKEETEPEKESEVQENETE